MTEINLRLGTDIIRSYRRLSYTPWHALAEFVDNSTQSYFNNREVLEKAFEEEGEGLEVRIVYDRDEGLLRISDNAMGMNAVELQNALRVGHPPAISSGRSQFGLGLKTASCWLGDEWSLRTKRLGEPTEYHVTVDVESVADGNTDLPTTELTKPADLHYSILEIRNLHSQLRGRTLGKIRDFLKSMYRVDLRDGFLSLYWGNEKLEWNDDLDFLTTADGGELRRKFEFAVDGHDVNGWVGVLRSGSRAKAGFSIIRRGRVVRGYPDSWRPSEIFGQLQGTNDLINQRVVGEIHLDEFEVTHTKDDILWRGDQQDVVEQKLREAALDYLSIARAHRKGAEDGRGPSEAEVETAVEELRGEMESEEFVDFIDIEDIPEPELAEEASRPILENAARHTPVLNIRVGTYEIRVHLATDASPNDPYYAREISQSVTLVVVNTQHPHWSQLSGSEGVLNYLRQCVFDAIAEGQCWHRNAVVQPDTIKMLKDRLLRLPLEIEHARDAAVIASNGEN